MSTDPPVSQRLPGRLMHAALRGDLVDYLVHSPLPGRTRRNLYRQWCQATMSSVLREDLDRIAPTRTPVNQRGLF
jgi:hypothetical protein